MTVLRAEFFYYDPDTGLLRPDARNASYQVNHHSLHTSKDHAHVTHCLYVYYTGLLSEHSHPSTRQRALGA